MSWTKHFRTVANPTSKTATPPNNTGGIYGTSGKYASILPEIFAGNPNRIQRYYQFDDMARDSDVSAALDTIADFCTQSEEQSKTPFEIDILESGLDESAVKLLDQSLVSWVRKNDFKKRLWKIFRDTIKYGDTFFVEDPETCTWYWVDQYSVELVKVSSDGFKKPQEYIVKNFDPNITERFATTINDMSKYRTPSGSSSRPTSQPQVSPQSNFQMAGEENSRGNALQENYVSIDANKMVHLSLNEQMDQNWPFGGSVLEPVFKTFKQKELLEDAILIYRVQRAPERRIFYIDTGEMPPMLAKAHLEQVKTEIHQRRIPNRSGGASTLDAAYNPLSMLDDYFFAQPLDGRGSRVETLPGGDSIGEIADLTYFTKKLARGLQIPTSYLPLGDDESPAQYNDGRLGQTMIQEFKFTKYCIRLQNLLAPIFDKSFKNYLDQAGITIDTTSFEIRFLPPQNFSKYRQIEIDQQQAQVYSSISNEKLLSKRFMLERYLGLSEAEILRNQEMWAEENARKIKDKVGLSPAESDQQADLGSVGISSSGGFDDFDDGGFDDFGDDGFDAPDLGGGDIPPPPAPDGGE